jgi:AraC-like DNA-binding protein
MGSDGKHSRFGFDHRLKLRFERVEHDSPLGRWSYTAAHPVGHLATWVELFWTVDADPAYGRERILPRSTTEVLFNLGEQHRLVDGDGPGRDRVYATSWVSGLQRQPLSIESPSRQSLAGIRLRTAGALPFLGLPPTELAGRVLDLPDLLGRGVEALREQLAEERCQERRLRRLASNAARWLNAGRPLSADISHALNTLHTTGGNFPIRVLVRNSGFSERYFISRFRAEVGLTPKMYARIVRFERALAEVRLRPAVNWAQLADDCGYYDQAHLALDFRELAGASPREVLRRLGPDGPALVDG